MPFFQLLLIRSDGWQQGQSSFAWQVVTVWLHVFCKEGMIVTHKISVRLSEDIRPFLGGIFSTHLSLWALFYQHSFPRGSELSDLRGSWYLPPDRSQVFHGSSIVLTVFPSLPHARLISRVLRRASSLWVPQALAYFSASPASSSLPFLQLLAVVCVPPLKKKKKSLKNLFCRFWKKKKIPVMLSQESVHSLSSLPISLSMISVV